jgi:hypothetical protein
MKKILETYPLYVFLLPLFFVLHGCLENFGYILIGDAALLAGVYLLGAGLVFGLFLVICRRFTTAGLAAGYFLAIFFFFGALHDFLKDHIPPAAKYSILVPVLLLAGVALLIFLKRTRRSFRRWPFFLNCLFIIYILIEGAGVLVKSHSRDHNGQAQAFSGKHFAYIPYTDTVKQDIYFLLFDAYASSLALKEQYHYDNGEFDSFLSAEGFHIQRGSRSNYKYTILSMPSILNMSYLDKLKDVRGGPVQEYYYLTDLIRDNELISFLQTNGYEIVNCSIFDLRGNPSLVEETLLPIKTRLITDQTFYSRFSRDIGWNIYQFFINPFSDKEIYQSLNNDNKLIAALKQASGTRSDRPRFFYGHFNIPHPPYYFDKNGDRIKVKAMYTAADEDLVQGYLDYLHYTNARAEEMIRTIKKNTGGKAVIILMGDHGLRYHDQLGYNPLFFVQNQNAVYFPDKDYHLFYDSISGVNQFRVVLNSLFKQNIPLLKDSTVNVKDKK